MNMVKLNRVMKMLERAVNLRNNLQLVDLDGMVPQNHLLRKIDKTVDFSRIYDMVEHLYCEDNGRPAVDPVVLVKMVFIQHLYGIKSLRQTVKEIDMNIAYRWFLGFDLSVKIPHFATISYALTQRFPSEIFEEIFAWILEEAVSKGYIDASAVFIDATHVKANANRNKKTKVLAQKAARRYDRQLREEINQNRQEHGKKPLKDNDDNGKSEKLTTKSTTDPESGLFCKGEHKTEFAYTTHVACDKKNFVLESEVTPGNTHDSIVFDTVYDRVVDKFPEITTVVIDAGYKTPWICKKVIDDGRNPSTPYKRPMGKRSFFYPYEYVYDEYYNCVICPNDQVLSYTTTNRDGYREFKSDPSICKNCPHLSKCTNSKNHQKVVMKHIWEHYIDQAEDFRHTEAGRESYRLRSQTIERVFADAKEKHAMRYTLLKGLTRVKNWVKMKFAAMNLKKMAMWAY